MTQYFNRENEKLKRQSEYRTSMFGAIIEFRNDLIKNKTFNQVLYDKVYLEMQLYGTAIEIKALVAFIESLKQDQKNGGIYSKNTEELLVKLTILCRDGMRNELDLEKLP